MEDIYDKYKRIFLAPNRNDITNLKDSFIELKDFEYYENQEYNPMFMRTLANTIYAINSIYMDFQNDIDTMKNIFHYMPFGFGKINKNNNDIDIEDIVLYTKSNEENFYKCLNQEDFLIDILNELKGKAQKDFSFRTEGGNINDSYSGIMYEENSIYYFKNMINNKKDLKELPNLIFYINKNRVQTIEKISNIFELEVINDTITNSSIQIRPKQQNQIKNFWPGIVKKEKKYFGYNELDFVFLNEEKNILELNRIYRNILNKDENIVLKKGYSYFVEIKLTFPEEPDKQIKKLFKKAKNLYSLYKKKYNLEHLGIILIYDTVQSIGNEFCNNNIIEFTNPEIDFHLIYLHVTVQVSNMNYLTNKISSMENRIKYLEENSVNFQTFKSLLFKSLKEILPDKEEIITNLEENFKIGTQNIIRKDNNEIYRPKLENIEKKSDDNKIIEKSKEEGNIDIQSDFQKENKNPKEINKNYNKVSSNNENKKENNDLNKNLINNIQIKSKKTLESNKIYKNLKNIKEDENIENIESKENFDNKINIIIPEKQENNNTQFSKNKEISNSKEINKNNNEIRKSTESKNDNQKNHCIKILETKVEEDKNILKNNPINESIFIDEKKFHVIEDRFKDLFIKYKLNSQEFFSNSANIFKEIEEEISEFNKLSQISYLKRDTEIKRLLYNSLFQNNILNLEKINEIFEEIIKNEKIEISKQFINLKRFCFGINVDLKSPLFIGVDIMRKFIKKYVYNTIFLLEKDVTVDLDIYYSSLLKSIIDLIIRINNRKKYKKFFHLVDFCLKVYENNKYSINDFISNFIEGLNETNEEYLVGKQTENVKKYSEFIKLNEI